MFGDYFFWNFQERRGANEFLASARIGSTGLISDIWSIEEQELEVFLLLNQMHINKSAGPDDISFFFYNFMWWHRMSTHSIDIFIQTVIQLGSGAYNLEVSLYSINNADS